MPLQVTEIEETAAAVAHPLAGRFRFYIIENGGMGYVVCTLTYRTLGDAEAARRAASDMLKKAVSATR
jgi:hypothetical protein